MRMLILSVLLLFPGIAVAAKGEITNYPGGCDTFLVETPMGFALLEWYGGNDPSEGDVIVGDFEAYGLKDVYNTTVDAELRVWVEDYWLSREDAIENLYEECG